ncbi:hypothetical protein GCM10022259_30610 [Aquimarina mytili]
MGCSNQKKTDKETITIGNKKKEKKVESTNTSSVPIMLENKGIGPITSVTFDKSINQNLADKGEQLFKSKCVACHKASQKFIGPPMVGIYKKRSPEWVMNMIMNPDEMLKKDPVAIALLKEYNNTIMLNQNISEDEARAMAEWFRTLNE